MTDVENLALACNTPHCGLGLYNLSLSSQAANKELHIDRSVHLCEVGRSNTTRHEEAIGSNSTVPGRLHYHVYAN